MYFAFCILGIVHWCITFNIVVVTVTFYKNKYLFYIGIYQNKISNCEIIATQICPDTENVRIVHSK